MALCALLHAHFPERIGEYGALEGHTSAGRAANFRLALGVAAELGISPNLLDVDSMLASYPKADPSRVFLLVSQLYNRLHDHKVQPPPPPPRAGRGALPAQPTLSMAAAEQRAAEERAAERAAAE